MMDAETRAAARRTLDALEVAAIRVGREIEHVRKVMDVELVRESMAPGALVTESHLAACERLRGTPEMAELLRAERKRIGRQAKAEVRLAHERTAARRMDLHAAATPAHHATHIHVAPELLEDA